MDVRGRVRAGTLLGELEDVSPATLGLAGIRLLGVTNLWVGGLRVDDVWMNVLWVDRLGVSAGCSLDRLHPQHELLVSDVTIVKRDVLSRRLGTPHSLVRSGHHL